MSDILRVYFDPDEIGPDGYPYVWHGKMPGPRLPDGMRYEPFMPRGEGPVKDLIREQAGNRCERCGHPYEKGMGEWSPCDEHCTHGQPLRMLSSNDFGDDIWVKPLVTPEEAAFRSKHGRRIEAQWRILTVHHLNGVKHDLCWWNLAALCQRCHLTIQAKVHMHREWNRPHTEWFKMHAAGFYAAELLGEDLTREETAARLDELLNLQLTQHPLPGFV